MDTERKWEGGKLRGEAANHRKERGDRMGYYEG